MPQPQSKWGKKVQAERQKEWEELVEAELRETAEFKRKMGMP